MRNPLSLEAFAEWLEQQPAEKSYDFFEPANCAIAQYMRHLGFRHVVYSTFDCRPMQGDDGPTLPREMIDVVVRAAGEGTFGRAARYARLALRQ